MASIRDVAELAGVSIASVSRVLNTSRPVADETRDRVIAAASQLSFSIDQRARGIRTQKSRTLGLVVADVGNPFTAQVLNAIEAVAYRSGYDIFLCNSDEDPDRERLHCGAMMAQRIAGVIVMAASFSGTALAPLLRNGVPIVCLDRKVDDVELDSILVNNDAGGIMAANYKEEGGYDETLALLTLKQRPTALFIVNHPMTIGALRAIQDFGLHVPGDVSVLAFDDPAWAPLLAPALSTIRQPTDQLGMRAAQMLIDRVEGRYAGTARSVVLAPRYMERASIAPPPPQRIADRETPAQKNRKPN